MESTGVIIMASTIEKNWLKNYDNNQPGNFEDVLELKAKGEDNHPIVIGFENQMTAMLESKGLLATQAKSYIDEAYREGGTALGALKHIAATKPSAADRGDVWGDDADITKGASFLKAQEGSDKVKSDNWQDNAALISDLYTSGFGREADTEGLKYWTDQLSSGNQTYADIARAFGASEEAQIRTDYHTEFGRDVDDAGLQYWLRDETNYSKAALTNSLEGAIRDGHADALQQYSKEDDRIKGGVLKADGTTHDWFTDAQEGGYANLDWRDYSTDKDAKVTDIQTDFDGSLRYDFGHQDDDWSSTVSGIDMNEDFDLASSGTYSSGADKTGVERFRASVAQAQGHKMSRHDADLNYQATSQYSGDNISTLQDVQDVLERRESILNVTSRGDVDDAEGGTGIGRMFTLDEMKPWMHKSKDLDDLAKKLGKEKWVILTKELEKYKDFTPTGKLLHNPGMIIDERDTNRNTLSNNYQVPVPPDYQSPDLANVNRQNVDYMPDLDGTVPNRPLRKLDSSYTTAPQQAVRKQGAFVAGTSAQGVRRRQSSAARSGRSAMGTKQLARNNMQIKSLNI